MAFSLEQIQDFIKLTFENVKKNKYTDIASALQKYLAMNRLMKKHKVTEDGGDVIQWPVMVTTLGSARHVGPYSVDVVVSGDVMQMAEVGWRHTEQSYAFDKSEFQANMGKHQIVNLIKTKRGQALIDLAALFESTFWGTPSSSTDVTTPYGLLYWLIRKVTGSSATASTGEFGGGNPTGFTSGAAGLNSTTYPTWANWTHQYVNYTGDDVGHKMEKAAYKTDFESPIDVPDPAGSRDENEIFTTWVAYKGLKDMAKQQNDRLGFDVDPVSNKLRFQGNKVNPVPQLDSDTNDPILGVNWSTFYPVMQQGDWMQETVKPAPEQHRVTNTFIDCTWQTKCTNRRKQWYLSK